MGALAGGRGLEIAPARLGQSPGPTPGGLSTELGALLDWGSGLHQLSLRVLDIAASTEVGFLLYLTSCI